jgi:parvulin-like peptidyl-prolyl isomerase
MEDNKDILNSEEAAEETGATSPAAAEDEALPTENFNAEEAEEVKNTKTTETAAPKTATVAASSAASGMSAAAKGFLVVAVILALGAGLLIWKIKTGSHESAGLTKLTNEDIALLLKDENPMALKQLSENPETKKKIVESLKQTLAMASQARKDGMAKDPDVKEDLEAIRTEITAASYDKKKNSDKGPMPPFGFITEDQVKAYYAETGNEEKFKSYIDKKIAQAKEEGRIPKDREPTEDQLNMAKDSYAKARIYAKEAEEKKGELGEEYNKKVDLQVRLQQEQFLARRYADKVLKEQVKVTDADVAEYLKAHPELDTKKEKKAKAEEILARAQKGEDFAALAKEFSEDPGSKADGGLYKDRRKGQFVPEFEAAALALEPGQIAPQPVETKFGYHIIKLEKKGMAKDANGQESETYDARHILISTMVTDPENPRMPPMPAEDKVRAQLEEEKEKKVFDDLLAKNPIEIPDDFVVPEPSAEQLEQMKKMQEMQMQQQMQQMQQTPGSGADETDLPKDGDSKKKPEPKKK